MKILNGSELAGFIKKRQAEQAQNLITNYKINPNLSIIQCIDDPVINTYVRLKKAYGEDINIDVKTHKIKQDYAAELIKKLNKDATVNGIIIQLPLQDKAHTDELVNLVDPEKDVDALGANSIYEPATPMAILWLLAGYNINLKNKNILLIGRGKLVGAPLEKILKDLGHSVTVADRKTNNLNDLTLKADIIITATGSPAILFPSMVKSGVTIVDAGVASENGKTVGDVSPEMYNKQDITITPTKGGVGPLTICALFENVIRATNHSLKN